MKKYLLALDQGTTSSRAILFDTRQNLVGQAQREFTQYFPQDGWVEHDPLEIWGSQYAVMLEVLDKTGVAPEEVIAIGITNQRETAILWDRHTGKPVYNAIVWQCRRTAPIVEALVAEGLGEHIRETCGLVPDAYFSGTKIKWILDNVPGVRERAERGDILFGTVDSWLLWNLTGGKVHATDLTNASRTMLFDIRKLAWDETLLRALDIPASLLPAPLPSSWVYGTARVRGTEIPITGIAGDQQAALFGQGCFEKGEAKNTYGTGCFLLMNTGGDLTASRNGLITTLAAALPGKVQYALEGSVFVGGAVIQWLRDELGLIRDAKEAETVARSVPDNGGVYLVPAFTGLGAPHWDMYARGAILGLTRAATRAHIVRAAEEAIAYEVADLVRAMEADAGIPMDALRADGGASRDGFLLQFQADILQKPVRRPVIRETTALGAANLAGLAAGVWKDTGELASLRRTDAEFVPQMEDTQREKLLSGWQKAVSRSRDWAK